jgi:replicative DNA helicase
MPEQNPIPHSKEAEEALIGAAIIDPSTLLTLDITPADFYIQRNRWIWEALIGLAKRGMQADFVTLTDTLEASGKLGEIGGASYLADMVSGTITSMHAREYAGIVREKARRRKMLEAASDLAKAAYSKNGGLDEAAMRAVQTITGAINTRGAARPLAEYISYLYDDVTRRAANPSETYGLSTGLIDFDKLTGGLQPGEAIYIAGDPGVGKSILSIQMGLGMAQAGEPGVIYSLEMRGKQVTRRMVSSLGRIETRRLKTGKLEGNDWQIFTEACEVASSLPIWMSDEPYLTTGGLRADLARLKAAHGIRWFVLDYLLLMSDGMGEMKPTERSELLSSRTKLLCNEFDLAGVTVNSVTKEGDLRGSMQVQHDADIVAMLLEHQPDATTGFKKEDNMRTLAFKKGRELEDARRYLHLVKHERYPAFDSFIPDANAQRIAKTNGRQQ